MPGWGRDRLIRPGDLPVEVEKGIRLHAVDRSQAALASQGLMNSTHAISHAELAPEAQAAWVQQRTL